MTALRITPALLLAMFLGCRSAAVSRPTTLPADLDRLLSAPILSEELDALCRPPVGWQPQAIEQVPRTHQRVWVSPSGRTAYGVIYIHLPLPATLEIVLWGFMNQMRKTEGEARLLSRERDSALPGLRFVAEGTRHHMRAYLRISGLGAWVVYAGTLTGQPEDPDELRAAVLARENTTLRPSRR